MTTVLVTGATGFVGRWLCRALTASGDVVRAFPPSAELDLAAPDAVDAVVRLVRQTRPDAVVHLAGVAYAPDAARDPERALAVAERGTAALLGALDRAGSLAPVLAASSGEVYGPPTALPLTETSPLHGESVYARSKRREEAVVLAAAARRPVVVTRAFNHTGPGQRPEFVAPALARRVREVATGRASRIRIGNVDVRRDFSDVRDVAAAYVALVAGLVMGSRGAGGEIFNVASGRSTAIGDIVGLLWAAAGLDGPPPLDVDPALIRPGEPRDIRGDAGALTATTGWRPTIELATTLADLYGSIVLSDEPD